jgi:hypothetical protein
MSICIGQRRVFEEGGLETVFRRLETHNLADEEGYHCRHQSRGSVRRPSGFVLTAIRERFRTAGLRHCAPSGQTSPG